MTNREWLFTLGIEDLAWWLDNCRTCIYHGEPNICFSDTLDDNDCIKGTIMWLEDFHNEPIQNTKAENN